MTKKRLYKYLVTILILLLMSSCANIRLKWSITITGEYEDKFPYYEVNQELHENYGINYWPKEGVIRIGKKDTLYTRK